MPAERSGNPGSVLMTADVVGGVWTYAIQLSSALAAYKVSVTLAAMGGRPSPAQRAQADALGNVTLEAADFRLEWMDDPWEDLDRAGEWLLDLEARVHPGVVHLNNYAHGHLPFRSPVVVVGHSCVLSWWEAVRLQPLPASWDRYREVVRAGLRGSQTVVAPSQAMLNSLRKFYGPLSEAVVIPNGLPAAPAGDAIREEMIFTAGRIWDEAKNMASLSRIAGSLPWPIVAAGSVGDSAPPPGLQYVGHLSQAEMKAMLSRASIYALPALYEPFGLSVLEAAQCGCALVLGNIASLRENWHGAALFADPRDDKEIQHAIHSLLDDLTLRRRLSQAARDRSRAFTSTRMAESYMHLYRTILTRQAAQACA